MGTLNPTEQRLKQTLDDVRGEQKLTHAALAERLGVKPPAVTALLTRKSGMIPQSLINLLDALDLEVVFQPKAAQHDQ